MNSEMRIFTALAVGIADTGTECRFVDCFLPVSLTAFLVSLADSAAARHLRSECIGSAAVRQLRSDCIIESTDSGSAEKYDPDGQDLQESAQKGSTCFIGDRSPDDLDSTRQQSPDNPEQSEESLILRIGQGDKSAFAKLYETTSNAVYAYAFSLLMDREDAEDVMQETFLKIHAAAHLYRPQGKPMAWIMTIARNLCMSRFRGKKKQTELMPAHTEGETGLSLIRQAEDRMVLEAAMDVLSQEELRIIVLHGVSGVKHREISEIMQIPLSTVLSRYHRGLRKLRKRLEGTER